MDFLLRTPKAALWWQMGTGKTRTVLRALELRLARFDCRRVLIVAPLRVTTHVWPTEIHKWGFRYSWAVIRGSEKVRRAQVADGATVNLINYDLLRWLCLHYQRNWPYDCVVFDESSKLKSPRTKRFKAFKRIAAEVRYVVELTGTPVSNGLLDLWSQIFLLDGGARLGTSFGRYQQTNFIPDYMGYSWTPQAGAREKIYRKVNDLVDVLKAQNLPPRVNNVLEVALPSRARIYYEALLKESLLMVDQSEILAANAGVLTNKLQQCANGRVYDTEQNVVDVHTAKLEALEEVIEEAAGEPVLVVYTYQHDLAQLRSAYPKLRTLDDKNAINDWNAGKVPLLVVHPASAGHGLNLQYGGKIVCWFGLNWSLELYQQTNARLWRSGQTGTVFVHHIVAVGTVDEQILAVLQEKLSVQEALLNALGYRPATRTG